MTYQHSNLDNNPIIEHYWKIIGITVLALRFVQGWIFWGGGSRRFIYDPSKLDPHAPQWMANKLQSAMPGALLGVGSAINFLLQHFTILYIAIIGFSLIELLTGAALILGCFTRLAGFISALLSIFLMLTFGWQGSTCLDEWTMAISNLAMGLTLALAGSSFYSVDNFLLNHYPQLYQRNWFLNLASGPLPYKRFKLVSIIFVLFTIAFTLITYNYYRGSIVSHYHTGPVSAAEHHITLSDGKLSANGAVSFNLYIDAGTPAVPSNIVRIELLNAQRKLIQTWEGKQLADVSKNNIKNNYDYNRVTSGFYGISAPMSSKAEITLPPSVATLHLPAGNYLLVLYTVNGQRFELPIVVK